MVLAACSLECCMFVAIFAIRLLLILMSAADLQSGHTGNNFAQLGRNDGLSQSVELERHLVDHLTGVLRRTVHGDHTRRLLGRVVLLQATVQGGSQRKLGKVLDNVAVYRVVGVNAGGRFEAFDCGDWDLGDFLGHGRLVVVEHDRAGLPVVLHGGLRDGSAIGERRVVSADVGNGQYDVVGLLHRLQCDAGLLTNGDELGVVAHFLSNSDGRSYHVRVEGTA